MNLFRRRRPDSPPPRPHPGAHSGGSHVVTAGSPATARQDEALEHLYAHIRRLPPLDRSLILLQLDGLGYAEIAGIHGLSESNVGARLSRLKQKLADAMKEVTHELR